MRDISVVYQLVGTCLEFQVHINVVGHEGFEMHCDPLRANAWVRQRNAYSTNSTQIARTLLRLRFCHL